MTRSNYSIINIVLTGLIIYLLLLPLISPFMDKIFPDIWQCQYLRITGKECPFCGLTRDFRDIIHLSGRTPHNHFAVLFFVFCVGEVFLRTAVSFAILKKKSLNDVIRIDIIYNIIFIILIIVCIVNHFI